MYAHTYMFPAGEGQRTVSLGSLLHCSHRVWCVHLHVACDWPSPSLIATLLLCMLENFMRYSPCSKQKLLTMLPGTYHAVLTIFIAKNAPMVTGTHQARCHLNWRCAVLITAEARARCSHNVVQSLVPSPVLPLQRCCARHSSAVRPPVV